MTNNITATILAQAVVPNLLSSGGYGRQTLYTGHFSTPVDNMIAIANEHGVYFLGFLDQTDLRSSITSLLMQTHTTLVHEVCPMIETLAQALTDYFYRGVQTFQIPCIYTGTPFQIAVWEQLATIPYGRTASYTDIATHIGRPTAVRAVANANGANRLAILRPCHRVIHKDGTLGGYNGGVERKKWLLEHEHANI